MKLRESVCALTPAEMGFHMPAEWEPHEATWMAWPHNQKDWPQKYEPIPWVYGEIVRKLAAGEMVRILVGSQSHEYKAHRMLRRIGAPVTRVQFLKIPTNRCWTRDYGPIFVKRPGRRPELAVVRFHFNAWMKYSDWKKDDAVAEIVAKILKLDMLRARRNGHDIVFEGGGVDVNGRGTLLTTEEWLLDSKVQVRNPDFSRRELEQVLCDYVGVSNIVWLGKGIVGDDAHGHVDNVCRFVGPRTVVLCQEKNPRDPNCEPLHENRERLANQRLEDGSRIEVVPLPMPTPLHFNGKRLPASYANFYVSNAVVLVPTFNDPQDRMALGILGELFRDRTVVGIHAVDLIWGLGSLHCITQQQPQL